MNQMKVELEGGCFVSNPSDLRYSRKNNWAMSMVIGKIYGSIHISQYYFRIYQGQTPIRSFGDSDVVLYILKGNGTICISGKDFNISAGHGVYVKPNEAFSFLNNESNPIECIAGVCPECVKPQWLGKMPTIFDTRNHKRVVGIDEHKKNATGDRFYQYLVNKKMGSSKVTQFIGSIPKSRAPGHFHLYEESITVLSGSGFMWAGDTKAPVAKGSMIFLPKKQVHCLECTVDEGMLLVGLFYPAGSPKVSYN